LNPASHFLISWTVANSIDIPYRDRNLVTLSGILADIDGVGIIAEVLTENTTTALLWYSRYHHILGHNLFVGLILAAAVFLFGRRKLISASLAVLVFHLHLLGDLIGSRGPDGYQWPIPYLFPFSKQWTFTWQGQWELNAWPNFLVTLIVLGIASYLTWNRGRSPLEMFSTKADQAFLTKIREKLGCSASRN
jgi:hypothetical protein